MQNQMRVAYERTKMGGELGKKMKVRAKIDLTTKMRTQRDRPIEEKER